MKVETAQKTIGYHYSNLRAYRSMQTKGIDGYFCDGFNDFIGLIPRGRFIAYGNGVNLPDEAHKGVIEAVLEPEPESWLENPEFPSLWRYLMHDICREEKIMLLSFELKSTDKAFVVERAHVERELYRQGQQQQGRMPQDREALAKAYEEYWHSRVPAFDYDGRYTLPQLAIWSGIEFDRLRVEWAKPHREVWQRVLDNNW